MTAFEFFISFFSLIMGLAAATLAAGLAEALRSRRAVKIGVLTPLLALFMLMDISTFWAIGWVGMQDIQINYATIYFGLAVSLPYFLAAAIAFPKDPAEWPSLDVYYDSHKRLPLMGVIFCNAVGVLFRIGLGDFDGFTPLQAVRLSAFFGALIALILVRNRRVNIALLVLLCLINLAPAVAPWTAAAGDA